MLPDDSNIFHDIKRLAEHLYYSDRQKGKRNDAALLFMGGSMVGIGCVIAGGAAKRLLNEMTKGRG